MSTEIKQFSKVDLAVAILKDKYAVVPDCSTEEGFEEAKESHRDIRSYQITLEKTKKKLTENFRKKVTDINNSANDIDSRLDEIGLPFKAKIDKRKEELAAIEAKRISDLRDEIATFKGFIDEAIGATSSGVSSIIESVDFIEVDEHFDELQAEARETLNEVKAKLSEMLASKVQAEIDEKKAAELQAENDKILEEQKAAKDKLIERNKGIIKDKMVGYIHLIQDLDELVEMDTYDLSVLLQERIDAEVIRVAQAEEDEGQEETEAEKNGRIQTRTVNKRETTPLVLLPLFDFIDDWQSAWAIDKVAYAELSAGLKARGLI